MAAARIRIFHGVVRRLPDSIAWKIRRKIFHSVENPDYFCRAILIVCKQ
jgi:hypothetical protein